MYSYKDKKRVGFQSVGIVVLLIALLFTTGCDAVDLLAPIQSVNLILPLGLSGGSGLLNPPDGMTFFGIPLTDGGTSPPLPPVVGTSR
ncbi:MAG: hypothetical protein ACYTF1_06305 [Planctomycetota bacterium]|jgi:hypothetical protein